MRKLALFAAVGASLIFLPGCARWTLRPLHGPRSASAKEDKPGELTALMQKQAGQGQTATDVVDPTIARAPNAGLEKMPTELAVARLSERQGDINQALQLYEDYAAQHPQHPLAHHRLGVIAARNSKLDDAEKHLRRALEVAPPSVDLLSDMGYLCYLQNRFDEAEHYLLQALEQSPDSASATNNLALVYGGRGDFDKSLRYFRRVNDDAKSHANVAFAMTQQGRLEDARNEYLHALTIDKSLRSAAIALVQIEQTRKAAQKATQRQGDKPDAFRGRDDVVELSTAEHPQRREAQRSERSDRTAGEREFADAEPTTQRPTFEPQRRRFAPTDIEPANIASGPAPRPQAANVDALAGRLMPLPALPADEQPEIAATTPMAQAAPAEFLPVGQLLGESTTSPEPADDRHAIAIARPHSRFTESETAASPDSTPPQAEHTSDFTASNSARESIFAQARHVSWDAQTSRDQHQHAVIPIPATQPVNVSLGDEVRQAVAIEPKSEKPAVRPAAVQIGLSDHFATAPPKAQPVKTQFSDFGTAPARLNTNSAAPLHGTR